MPTIPPGLFPLTWISGCRLAVAVTAGVLLGVLGPEGAGDEPVGRIGGKPGHLG